MKNKLRMTPQTKAVLQCVQQLGHATNRQILSDVSKIFPNLSATTVHRITSRLVNCGMLAKGPEIGGSITIDSNLNSHDHFICSNCNGLKDVYLSKDLHKLLQDQTGLSIKSSELIIYGNCSNCNTKHFA